MSQKKLIRGLIETLGEEPEGKVTVKELQEKIMIKYTPKGMERNARFWHVVQHLFGNLKIFMFSNYYKMYRDSMAKAASETGVVIIDFAIMPTHSHLLLMPPSTEALVRFMHFLNQSFAMKISHMKKNGKKITKVFSERPKYYPIGSIRRLFTCLRYIFNNPFKWNRTHTTDKLMMDEETGLYWKTAAQLHEKGYCESSFDPGFVQKLLGMQWSELRKLYCLPQKEFDSRISKLEKSMSPRMQNQFLKIDPDKGWTTDISRRAFPYEEAPIQMPKPIIWEDQF
ncbi:MAG: transposase [Sphaerochaetaceae bacterium]|nr:transposase [Sphaerochaetaceae bacterium]MDD4007966.1 transposase [Sphaerochaetaceae bacterium]MDD4397226.1 transposase [Sphaerochaetaceae bacterium]